MNLSVCTFSFGLRDQQLQSDLLQLSERQFVKFFDV
jgi:hypothetical protein